MKNLLIKICVIFLSVLFITNPVLALTDQSIITLEVDTTAPPEEEEEEEVTPPGGGGAGPKPEPVPPVISNVRVYPDVDSAVILWLTDEPATTEIEWGETEDYEKGTVVVRPDDLIIEHRADLEGLESDKVYHFRIKARNAEGGEAVTDDYSFRTLVIDLTPPANVKNFVAIPGDQKITLHWINPPDEDFAGVKIMRSEEFFPLYPDQGLEIYNSDGTEHVDTGLINGQRYYYTAFAYDYSDNFASGAIATAFPWVEGKPLPPEIPPIIPPEIPLPPLPPEWPPITPIVPPITPWPPAPVEEVTIQDVDFFQKDKKISPDEKGQVKLIAELPTEVYLPIEKLPYPYALKSIILNIALADKSASQPASAVSSLGQGQSASYLLKINKEKTAYQAEIVPPNQPGKYDLNLVILNYQEGTVTKLTGQLIIRQPLFLLPFQEIPGIYALILLILLILFVLLLVYLRSRRKKKKEKIQEAEKPGVTIIRLTK